MKKIMLSNEMLYPVLGVEGVSCKEIGVYGAIRWALKLGVNRFDIGKMCGSKDEILKAFEGARIEDDVKREDLVLSVCCGKKDGENLREELEQKLKDYFYTISSTGYLNYNTTNSLIVLKFLLDILSNPDLSLEATCEEIEIINNLIECIILKLCI